MEFVDVGEVLGRIGKGDIPAGYVEAAEGLYRGIREDVSRDGAKQSRLPLWAVFVAGYMMAERKEKGKAWRKGYRAAISDHWNKAHGLPPERPMVTTWKDADGDIQECAID